MKAITRAVSAKIDVLEGERAVVSTINTNAVDRYRTVIAPRGGVFDNYRLNPVVLLQHGTMAGGPALPVGRCAWIKATADSVVAKTIFMTRDLSEVADDAFRMYQGGFMNGWSISFDPIESSPPTTGELRTHPEWKEATTIFRRWELLEYSAVAVPANPEALSIAVSRGLVLPHFLEPAMQTQRDADGDDDGDEVPPIREECGQCGTSYRCHRCRADVRCSSCRAMHEFCPRCGEKTVRTALGRFSDALADGLELPPLVGRTVDQISVNLRSMIRREFNTASATSLQDAKDLARGDV